MHLRNWFVGFENKMKNKMYIYSCDSVSAWSAVIQAVIGFDMKYYPHPLRLYEPDKGHYIHKLGAF